MKRIFRSIINISVQGELTIPQEELKKNYRAFVASKVTPEDPSYLKIYHWIEAHFRDYDELPSITLIHNKSMQDGDEGVLASLKDIVAEDPFIGSDYRAILKEKYEEQNQDRFQNLIQDTWKIASSGMKVGKRKKKDLKGIQQAVRYFTSEAVKFRQGAGTRTSGDIRSEEVVNEILADYEARKRNPVASQSMYSFISRMDDTIRGIKPGQLMLVAGYSGMGKTTVAANLAYNGIYQGLNGLYITIEMTFKEITDVMTTLHSSAPKWYTHDKYSHLAGKINHEDVVFGELSELQEEFWKYQVKDWLDPNNGYGHLFLEQPTGTITPSEVTNLCYHYNSQLNEQGTQLDFLVLDYFGLMKEDAGQSARDWNTDLNSIIKKSKSLALTFNEGQMLRVISPFQINRAGYDQALKNDGVYPISTLSNANEAERTSDIVISVFTTDEMKKAGIAKIACMKHRQGATFSPFEAHLDFKTKRLSDFIQVKDGDSDELIQDIPMDV